MGARYGAILAVVWGCLAAVPLCAAPPEVPAKVEAPLREPTEITVKVTPGKKLGVGKAFDPKAMVLTRTWSDDPAVYVFSVFPKVAGIHRVVWWTEGEVTPSYTTVTVPGAEPDPEPDPTPKPPGPPAPGAKLFVVVLTDRLSADPAQTAAVADATFREYLTAGGHELDVIDTGTAAGKRRAEPYQPFLTAARLPASAPAVVLMDADGPTRGLVRSAVALPGTAPALIAAVKAVTGR